ncbi:hypothetical protein Tco_1453299, partial [Tanacetum coccineum]
IYVFPDEAKVKVRTIKNYTSRMKSGSFTMESWVLIPKMTFVGVESRALIPETTFVGVESKDHVFPDKAKVSQDNKELHQPYEVGEVLIPKMTFVGVESRALIPETTFVGVGSRVLIPEMTFVGVESRVLIPETNVWDTLVYPSDLVIRKQNLE